MQRPLAIAILVALGLVLQTSAGPAQDGGGRRGEDRDRGDGGGRDRGGRDGGGRDRGSRDGGGRGAEQLKALDTNGNGTIEPAEVPARARDQLRQAIQRSGMDPNQPISVDQLATIASQGGQRWGRGGPGFGGQGSPGAWPPNGGDSRRDGDRGRREERRSRDSNESRSSSSVITAPAIASFGVATGLPKVLGFGILGDYTGVEIAPSEGRERRSRSENSSNSSNAASASTPAAAQGGAEARVRGFAEGMLRQYDENKNGVLEKSEWSKMRGNPEAADTNHDGVVTVDELSVRLSSFGAGGGGGGGWGGGPPGGGGGGGWGGGPPGGGGGGDRGGGDRGGRDRGGDERGGRGRWGDRESDGGGDSDGGGGGSSSSTGRGKGSEDSTKKPLRFLTAAERLPDGLPSWFTRSDADADGQVSMAEYSKSWDDAKAAEFAKYDLNADGVVTPQESLANEKKKK